MSGELLDIEHPAAVLARRWIDRAPNPPRYGSPEWLALPQSDPRWVSAVMVAAEAWRTAGADSAARLAVEMQVADDEKWTHVEAEARKSVRAGLRLAPHAEMERRRYPWLYEAEHPVLELDVDRRGSAGPYGIGRAS